MARQRPAEEKLLTLLASSPVALETSEIAEALGWSRQNALGVASRLARTGAVVRERADLSGSAGRPSDAWALPGLVQPPGVPQRLAPHTVVVTPSGEEARVVRISGKYAEIEYITGPERFQRVTLHVNLLREFQPGRERPAPARVAA